MNDPIGQAIYDFFKNGSAHDIKINTNYTEDESIPPSWFFRDFNEMPEIEQAALQTAKGKVLDVGAGAGSHALYLQKSGLDATALEKSQLAVEVMKKRGVNKIIQSDLLDFEKESFDTILILMNGTGLSGTLGGLQKMLQHLKKLLNNKGQILIDSSDIAYLFEEEDGSKWINLNSAEYYGEMDYEVRYKKLTTHFKWLFTDFNTLSETAKKCGFNCELVKKGNHHDFLARITKA